MTLKALVNNASEQLFFKKLQRIDWQTILNILINSDEGHRFNSVQAELAILQYRLFLFLLWKYPQRRLVPSQLIDTALHAHIGTTQFHEDCQSLFGNVLQHSPGLGTRGETDRLEWLRAFAQTKALFEQNFGLGSMGNSEAACCELFIAPV